MAYQPKTNRKRGMWDFIRSVAEKRKSRSLTYKDLLSKMKPIQARQNLLQMARHGDLVIIKQREHLGGLKFKPAVYQLPK